MYTTSNSIRHHCFEIRRFSHTKEKRKITINTTTSSVSNVPLTAQHRHLTFNSHLGDSSAVTLLALRSSGLHLQRDAGSALHGGYGVLGVLLHDGGARATQLQRHRADCHLHSATSALTRHFFQSNNRKLTFCSGLTAMQRTQSFGFFTPGVAF